MNLSNKSVLIASLCLLFAGIGLGEYGSAQDASQVQDRTVYVKQPSPTVTITVSTLPDVCAPALDVAVMIRDEAGKLDTASAPQADLMDRAQVAIQTHDMLALNKLIEHERKLRADTLGSATILQGYLYNYTDILNRCKEATRR